MSTSTKERLGGNKGGEQTKLFARYYDQRVTFTDQKFTLLDVDIISCPGAWINGIRYLWTCDSFCGYRPLPNARSPTIATQV